MTTKIEVSGRQLTRNWALNLIGQVLPLLVALACMPYVVHTLGSERFGVLSIIWAVLGSLSLFDLGLGRSTTKFVAECLGKDEPERFVDLFWTSLWSQLLLGIVGTVLMLALVPYALNHYLKSSSNAGEIRSSFLFLAASFPIVLGANSIRGVLEAVQRFDLVNYVKIPASISVFLAPVIALPLGFRLPAIVIALVLTRLLAALIYLWVCLRLFPALKHRCKLNSHLLRPLLVYGGWVSVSNFLTPLLAYADRFVVGSFLGISSVGYYAAPNEAITKASLLPGSLLTTLFPAFSSLHAGGARDRVEDLTARALKALLLLMTPALLLVIGFSHEILHVWLGADYAEHSTVVLQIFCVGVLVNSIAYVPFFLLQGLGRPDITAKFHLLELPVYGLLLWLLLPRMGLPGAALAWTLRLCLDAVLLFSSIFVFKFVSLRRVLTASVQRAILVVCVLASLVGLTMAGWGKSPARPFVVASLLLVFVWIAWIYVFDSKDKSLFPSFWSSRQSPVAPEKAE